MINCIKQTVGIAVEEQTRLWWLKSPILKSHSSY